MKPYYQHSGITIYHGDCREILPGLRGSDFDMLIADPPYGIKWQGSERTCRPMFDVLEGDDGLTDFVPALQMACDCVKRSGHIYIFGKLNLEPLKLSDSAELIWDKEIQGLGNLSLPWGPAHETITFATVIRSEVNRQKGDGRLTARLRRGSVIRVARLNSEAIVKHPTEKPVLLIRQLIESSSLIGDSVLDPFMGSGATIEAARTEGRRAIGIEIEEKYCEIAAKRLSQEVFDFTDQEQASQRVADPEAPDQQQCFVEPPK